MKLETRPITPGFGVEVLNADLSLVDAEMTAALTKLMARHGVLLCRRQSLHDEDILRLAQSWGEVEEPAALRYHAPGFKNVNYISNLHDDQGNLIGGLTPKDQDEGVWHSDQAFRKRPATISSLFCVHKPPEGGNTSFTSTVLGYAALPEQLKARVQGLRGKYMPAPVHDVPKVEVTHPVVSVNPITEVRALYLAPNTRGFGGMDAEEGEALKAELLGYLMRKEHQYTHDWRMGDMLLYDNCQFIHRREAFRGLRWLKQTRSFANPAHFFVPN